VIRDAVAKKEEPFQALRAWLDKVEDATTVLR
jgi:hypothetical protein